MAKSGYIYIRDASLAPKGATVQTGKRGGIYYIKGSVAPAKTSGVKPTKEPKGKAAPKGKAPKAAKPEKRQTGQPFSGPDDPNLPTAVKAESPDVRKAWVDTFNQTLADGGSDADAMYAAKQELPQRGKDGVEKPAKPAKREIGKPFQGGDDENLPSNVRAEAPQVRDAYARAFNDTLARGGSEADATFAAKQTLPKRTTEPPPKPKPQKRQIGQPFSGVDDPNISTRVRQESTQVREQWVKTFNATLKKNGSEADAMAAANKVLPDRTAPKKTVIRSGKKEAAMYTLITTDENTFEIVGIGEKDDGDRIRAMAALYPTPEVAAVLSQLTRGLSGEVSAPEDLHVTVAYYPDIEQDDIPDLIQQVAVCAAQSFFGAQAVTSITGVAEFAAPEGEPVPYVLLMAPTDSLRSLHNELFYASPDLVSREHEFIPHMTLAYVDQGQTLRVDFPPNVELRFNKLSLVVGDERIDFRIGGRNSAAIAEPAYYKEQKVDSIDDYSEDAVQPQPVVSQTTGEGVNDSEEQAKAGRRLNGGMRNKIADAVDTLKSMLGWADYEDEEDEPDTSVVKDLSDDRPFVVFKDANGEDRWISMSTNAFQDKDREIVSTKALEDVVAKADATGERGVLRLYHIPNTDIGICDFQGVHGRVLIESGTFLDTPFAQTAKEALLSWPEPLGVSIGFKYPKHAFDGQTYSELTSIFERSVLPQPRAANPWTAWSAITKEERVNPNKTAFLTAVVGQDMAGAALKQAEEMTKSLESSVAFKDKEETPAVTVADLLTTMKAQVEANATPEVKAAFAAFEQAATKEPDPPQDEATKARDEILAGVAKLIEPLATAVKEQGEKIAAQDATLAAMKEAETKSKEESNAPRGATVFRASEADASVLKDAEKVLEQVGMKEAQAAVSPAMPYIQDLLGSAKTGV